MDLFLDLYANFDGKIPQNGKNGIKISIFDPTGKDVNKFLVANETHKLF